ncbi:hypothetical protein LCGC14_2925140, partial [marine sediment metagenome]
KECLRVLKPGGTALIFAGSRTQHRMACNVEDAGFILKDCIMWLYGSGFPKATDISKQLDKGISRKVIGKKKGTYADIRRDEKTGQDGLHGGIATERPRVESYITEPTTSEAKLWNGWKSHGLKPAYEPILVAMKPNDGTYANNALKHGVAGLNIDGGRIGTEKLSYTSTFKRMIDKNIKQGYRPSTMKGSGGEVSKVVTGRFPANIILECICDNVVEGEVKGTKQSFKANDYKDETKNTPFKRGDFKGRGTEKTQIHTNPNCPCYILDKQSGELKSGFMKKGTPRKMSANPNKNTYMEWKPDKVANDTFGDRGGASRFFYIAKASKTERNLGCEELGEKKVSDGREKEADNAYQRGKTLRSNTHPTVKPLKLMEYLCTLTK